MKKLTVNCLYCGYNTSFIISNEKDIKTIKCFYCNETKLLKKTKLELCDESDKKNFKNQLNEPVEQKNKNLQEEHFDEPVYSGNGDGYFSDLYDDFFRQGD